MTEFPSFATFQPRPIPGEYILEFTLSEHPRAGFWLAQCTVSKIIPITWEEGDEEKQTVTPVLRVVGGAPFPEEAQHAAFTIAAYYIEHGILPPTKGGVTDYEGRIADLQDYEPDFSDQHDHDGFPR